MGKTVRRKSWFYVHQVAMYMLAIGAVTVLVPAVPKLVSVGVTVGTLLVLSWIRYFHPEAMGRARVRVEIDETSVRSFSPYGESQRCDWADLIRVDIVTTSDGPGAEDLYWVLFDGDGTGAVVPNSHAVGLDLLTHLHRLPRFDFETSVLAAGITSDARFTVWKGTPGEGLAAATVPAQQPAQIPGT